MTSAWLVTQRAENVKKREIVCKEIVYACLFAYTEWNPIKSDVKFHLIPPCPVSRISACWIRINTRLCLENMYPCTVLKIMNAQLQYFWRLVCIIFRNDFFFIAEISKCAKHFIFRRKFNRCQPNLSYKT